MSTYYGDFDGYSFCSNSYNLVIEPETKPFWMTIYGNLVVIGAMTEIDPPDSETITIKVLNLDGSAIDGVADRTFLAELVCLDDACDHASEFKSPTLLPTTPVCDNMLEGVVHTNELEDTWYVPV